MGHAQNGAAFFYAAHVRRNKAARKAAGKPSGFSNGMTLFLFFCVVAIIGAVIELASAALAFLPF